MAAYDVYSWTSGTLTADVYTKDAAGNESPHLTNNYITVTEAEISKDDATKVFLDFSKTVTTGHTTASNYSFNGTPTRTVETDPAPSYSDPTVTLTASGSMDATYTVSIVPNSISDGTSYVVGGAYTLVISTDRSIGLFQTAVNRIKNLFSSSDRETIGATRRAAPITTTTRNEVSNPAAGRQKSDTKIVAPESSPAGQTVGSITEKAERRPAEQSISTEEASAGMSDPIVSDNYTADDFIYRRQETQAEEQATEETLPEAEEPVQAEPAEEPEKAPVLVQAAEQVGEPEQQPAAIEKSTPAGEPQAAPVSVKAPQIPEPQEVSLNILTPEEGSFYGPVIHVEGGVTGGVGLLDARWEVMGTTLGGTVPVDNRGRFQFSFPTDNLSGDISLRVEASFEGRGVRDTMVKMKDNPEGPYLDIITPGPGDACRSEVMVRGRVWNNTSFPGRADGIKTLEYRITGTNRGGEVSFGTAGGYTFFMDTSGLNGALVLQMKATDYRGRIPTDTATLKENVQGPWVRIFEPQNGSFYRSSMTVRGRVADSADSQETTGEIARVRRFLGVPDGGEDVSVDTEGRFEFNLDTRSFPEQTVLTVRATDKNGHSTDAKIMLRDDGIGPSLDIRTPRDNALYEDSIVLEGVVYNRRDSTSPEGEVSALEWTILEVPERTGMIDYTDDGFFRFIIPLEQSTGRLTLEVSARDMHGNRTTEIISLKHAGGGPVTGSAGTVPELSLPDSRVEYRTTASVTGRLLGSGTEDIDLLSWTIRGTERQGTAKVSQNGDFSILADTKGLSGTPVMVLRAGESEGRVSRTVMLKESTPRPRLEITSPGDDDCYRSSVGISGSVSDRPDMQSLDELKSLT